MALCDLVHNPEKVHESIQVGCMESLKNLLTDKDSTVRQKASEVLTIMVTHNIGRNSFLDTGVVTSLAKLFDDEVEIVRRNSHECLEMLAEIPAGAQGIVEANLISILVEKLKTEFDEIKGLILDTLHFCMHFDAESALRASIMPALKELLSNDSVTIRAAAARDMMDVTVPLAGKEAACQDADVIPLLIKLLSDSSPDVAAKAAGAIMTITVTTKGKYKALEAGAIPSLLNLLNSTASEARLNALKGLTTLAEAPEGRKNLLGSVSDIEERESDASKAVARAAQIAKSLITWKP